MNSNEKLNLSKLLAKVFNFSERKITESDSSETIPNWDSFQALIMIQELERAADIKFDIEDLKNIERIADITKLLDKYKINYKI